MERSLRRSLARAARQVRGPIGLMVALACLLLVVASTPGGDAVAEAPQERTVVTGSAHLDDSGQGWRTASLHAVSHNGQISGHLELHNRATGGVVKADLDCAAFGADDYLIVSGPVRSSNDPGFHECLDASPSGRCLGAIAVKDNGQGRFSAPDEVTVFVPFYGFDEAVGGPLCEFLSFGPPEIFRLEAEAGNIQVHVEPGDL